MLLIYCLAVDICHAMHPGDGVSNAPKQRREKRGPNINTNFNIVCGLLGIVTAQLVKVVVHKPCCFLDNPACAPLSIRVLFQLSATHFSVYRSAEFTQRSILPA